MRWQLIDRIIECSPGKSILCVKCFAKNEEFFLDHFPGYPVVPGVLHIELIASAGAKLIKAQDRKIWPVLGSVKSAKFLHFIRPDDQCFIHAEVTQFRQSYAIVKGEIKVGEKKMSEALLMLPFIPAETVVDPNYIDPVLKEWFQRERGLSL